MLERNDLRVPLFIVVMTLSNFLFYIYPYARVRKETPLSLATEMSSVWSEHTIVYFSSMTTDNVLLRYFNPATSWRKIGEMKTADLESESAKYTPTVARCG